ncbi:MAG: dephospho-CoA kinase [Acidobacteriia bacterium]|nr:dephospho-CoA kinase [Terriglobia bacterium]
MTGGLACGKSFVGEALEKMGCLLIQADELGHSVLEPGRRPPRGHRRGGSRHPHRNRQLQTLRPDDPGHVR